MVRIKMIETENSTKREIGLKFEKKNKQTK